MFFKTNRPTYAIVLFALSSLWMCAMFLPLLYFVVSPGQELHGVVHALEKRGAPSAEAASVVQETIASVGPLTGAIPLAYYSGVTTTMKLAGTQTRRKNQASFIARFQKHLTPLLLLITEYESNG